MSAAESATLHRAESHSPADARHSTWSEPPSDSAGTAPAEQLQARPDASASFADLRHHSGLSLAALGDKISVSRTLIHQWERGVARPHPQYLRGLSRALGVELSQLSASFPCNRPARGDTVDVSSLRHLRRQQGLSVRSLAAALEVSASTVSTWEQQVAQPSPLAAMLLCQVLEVSLADLAGTPPLVETRGPTLRSFREAARLTQAEAARRGGLTLASLRHMERGRTPSLGRLRRLARVYRVPLSRLAEAAGVPPPVVLTGRWTAAQLPRLLRELRDWTDLTPADVDRHLGSARGTTAAWERGDHHPSDKSLRALENLWGLTRGALPRREGRSRLQPRTEVDEQLRRWTPPTPQG